MYIIDLHNDDELSSIEDIGGLAKKMIKTKRMTIWEEFFKLVYIFIKLSLLLPVATVIVESFFFPVMHIIKSKLRNRLRDKQINDSFVCMH